MAVRLLRAMMQKTKAYNQGMIIGLKQFFAAHDFVLRQRLKRHLLISGLVFLTLFSLSITAVIKGINALEPITTDWLLKYAQDYIKLSKDEITSGIKAIFWLIKQAIQSNKDHLFISLFMVFGSPYLSHLAQRIQRMITGTQEQFSWSIFWRSMKRSFKLALINNFKQWFWLLLITGFSFIPVLGILSPLFSFAVRAYYNGILVSDYALDQQEYNVNESRQYFKTHKPILFAFGLGFMFLLLIPVVGWFLAPTYALVASTLYFYSELRKSKAESKV